MNKRISVLLLLLLLLTGCNKLSKEDKLYNDYVKDLQKQEKYDVDFPFDININIEKLTDYEITYHLVIDNFDSNVNHIRALIIHDQETQDIYPSIGIYEEKIDVKKENKKGILLIGYIDYDKEITKFHGTFKAIIIYDKNRKEYTKYYQKIY